MKHAWQRLARRLGWDHNPLRRRIDRVEAATMSALLAAFVLGGPALAVVSGRMADNAGIREQRSEQGDYRQQATLLQSPDAQLGNSNDWGTAWVHARWTLKDGRLREGLVAVPLNMRVNQKVPVEVNAAGELTHPPLTASEVRDQVMFVVLSVTMGLALALAAMAGVLQILFNRHRIARWQRDWDAVGPLWSKQS
jgi:hypothetical protein